MASYDVLGSLCMTIGMGVLLWRIAELSSPVSTHKKALVFCSIAVFVIGFLGNPDNWPSNSLWEEHFSSALGGAIGTWFGTSVVYGAFFWLAIVVCIVRIVYCKIKEKNVRNVTAAQKKNESKIQALTEIETGNVDKLTWANALIAANGDEIKAKAEYIKLRGDQ